MKENFIQYLILKLSKVVKIYTVGKVMVALSYAPGSFEKYLFYFIQSKSVEYLLEPVYDSLVRFRTSQLR